MREGTVSKKFDRRYGFIRTSLGDELFFHSSAVQGTSFEELQVGQAVTYVDEHGSKGPRAESVAPR